MLSSGLGEVPVRWNLAKPTRRLSAEITPSALDSKSYEVSMGLYWDVLCRILHRFMFKPTNNRGSFSNETDAETHQNC